MAGPATNRPHIWATQPPDSGDRRFFGKWNEKYWKNIPGPFYSTTTNMMSVLPLEPDKMKHLIYDGKCEFIWRQPVTPEEYAACLRAMDHDKVGSFARDGNSHWTPRLVSQWWKEQMPLVLGSVGTHLLRPTTETLPFKKNCDMFANSMLLEAFLRYLIEDAEEYLRSYVFLLLNGRAAKTGDVLPRL